MAHEASTVETLRAQQELLQKLSAELDDEREASSTAVSEALSMIHRLQGEKAALKLEASQYKRLAEEKLFHAEDSLETLEDLLYHKEMEVASLGFQVRAYECKLLSLGRDDEPEKEIVPLGSGSGSGSYWERIRDLDEQVKEIADYCPLPPHPPGETETETVCLSGSSESKHVQVQDIFEVPKLEESPKLCMCDDEYEQGDNLKSDVKEIALVCNKEALVYGTRRGSRDFKGELKRLRLRVEVLEGERACGSNREEERRLLAEIQEQLGALRAEIRDLKEKRQSPEKKEDQQVHCLKEAMLHFWF